LLSNPYGCGGNSARRTDACPLAGPGAQEHLMLDIVMLALGFGFFAASIGYAYACERL
jgi:hypothetical protein